MYPHNNFVSVTVTAACSHSPSSAPDQVHTAWITVIFWSRCLKTSLDFLTMLRGKIKIHLFSIPKALNSIHHTGTTCHTGSKEHLSFLPSTCPTPSAPARLGHVPCCAPALLPQNHPSTLYNLAQLNSTAKSGLGPTTAAHFSSIHLELLHFKWN